MITIDANINGLDNAVLKLNTLASGAFMVAPMQASVIEIETYMKYYPPPPPAIQGPASVPARTFTTKNGIKVTLRANRASGRGISTVKASSLRYVRTGKLGQSWATRVEGDGNELIGRVGTNLNYAPYVESAALQASIHEDRWHTDAQAVEQLRDKIVARFRAAVEGALR
jgi:hypothetical protein